MIIKILKDKSPLCIICLFYSSMRSIEECVYHTNKFVLTAVLQTEPALLRLSLQDLAHKAVYAGEYREEDIGREICQAVRL